MSRTQSSNQSNSVSGVTSDITTTGSTSVLAALSGSRTCLTAVQIQNSHATVGTWVNLLDGSTVRWTGYAAPLGGGFVVPISVNDPLRGSRSTAWNVQCETSGANVRASVKGYRSVEPS